MPYCPRCNMPDGTEPIDEPYICDKCWDDGEDLNESKTD